MSMLDYWRDAVMDALDEIGAFDRLTSEEIDKVAATMEKASDDKGFYSGSDAAPNPLKREVSDLQAALAAKDKEMEAQRAAHNRAMVERHCDANVLQFLLEEARKAGR